MHLLSFIKIPFAEEPTILSIEYNSIIALRVKEQALSMPL